MSLTSIDCQNMRVESAEPSDDRLLHAYLKSNDQEAFAVLVQRYGPMVWGVCRRIVRDAHDAEDAFQAAGFEGTRYTLEFPNGNEVLKVSGTFKLGPAQPKESIDLIPDQGETMHCRYEVTGDGLRLSMAAPGAPSPTEFKTQPNQPHVTFVFRRSTAPPLESADGRPP